MADLVFKVKADYDEVVFLRSELSRLRGEMSKVEVVTEAGQRKMADLQKQYESTSNELSSLVENAARAAVEMKEGMLGAEDAAISLMNSIKSGESAIQDVFASLSGQVDEVTTSLEDAQAITNSMLDDMMQKLSDLNRERNLAAASGDKDRVEALNEEISALEEDIDGQKELQEALSSLSDAANSQVQEIKEAVSAYEDLADNQSNVADLTEETAKAMKDELDKAMQDVLNKMSAFQDTSSNVSGALGKIKEAASSNQGESSKLSDATEVLTQKEGGLSKATIDLATNLAKVVLPANAAKVAISALTGGLGTAAIAVATILIKKLIEHYQEQKRAAEEAAEAQREMSETIAKSAAKPISSFEELRKKWLSLSSDMEKNEFLKENKRELDKLGISIDNVDQAEALFIEHTQDYWNAQITRARADLYRQQIQDKIKRKIELEDAIANGNTTKKKVVHKGGTYKNGGRTEWVGDWVEWTTEEQYELDQINKDLPEIESKFDGAVKSAKELDDTIKNVGRDANYQNTVSALKKDWTEASDAYDKISKDAKATVGQVADAKKKVEAASKAYKDKTGKTPEQEQKEEERQKKERERQAKESSREQKERERAYKQYGNKIKDMIRSVEGEINKERISAIEDGSEAVTEQFDEQKRLLVDKANEIAEEMKSVTGAEYDKLKASYDKLMGLIDQLDQLRRGNHQKQLDKKDEEYRQSYLTQYGSWEEKRLAIRDKYQKMREKRGKDETEWEKKLRDIQEKNELDAVTFEEKAYSLMTAQRGGSYGDQKVAIEEYYDVQIEAAKALNQKAKAAELLRQKEDALFDLETKFNYSDLFGDITRYTESQLATAKALGDELLKSGKLTIEQAKAVKEALNKIEDTQRTNKYGNRLPSLTLNEFLSETENLKKLKAQRLAMRNDESGIFTEEDYKKIEDRIDQSEFRLRSGIVNGIGKGLSEAAGYMRELADATGDVHLEELANAAEGMAFSFDTMVAAAKGDWASVISNVVSTIGRGIADEVKMTKELELRVKALADSLTLMNLSFDSDKFFSIFGSGNTISAIREYSRLAEDSSKELSDALDALYSADYKPEGKKGRARDADYITRLDAYNKAVKAGQKGLQTMLVKTKDRSGVLNWLGIADKYESLHDIAPEIFNADGTLNVEKTEVFLQTDMSQYLDETQKQALQNAVELQKKYKENLDGLKQQLASLFGSINNTLAEATMNGIKNGSKIGVEYMRDQMSGIVEQLGVDMLNGIYSAYTSGYQDKLLELAKSGKTEDYLKLLDEMYDGLTPVIETATEAAKEWYEGARDKGFDLNRAKNADATSQTMQSISETTGSAIQGGVTALRLSSEVRNQHLSIMSANLTELLRQQSLATTLANDVRGIQAEALIALNAIRNHTKDNLSSVQNIESMVESIERRTRDKL